MMDMIWAPYGIPTPQTEFRFHPTRRWRFDYAWENICIDNNGKFVTLVRLGTHAWLKTVKAAVEIEGAIWTGGRHTRGSGFVKDMEKYNEAVKMGWRIFRFTPQQLKKGEAQAFMKQVFGGG